MLSKNQGSGVAERMLYGAITFLAARAASRGWIDPSMVEYVAAGAVMLVGSAWAWWINRPSALLSAAGNQLPKNAELVITTTPQASYDERKVAHELANAASEKVIAKTPVA